MPSVESNATNITNDSFSNSTLPDDMQPLDIANAIPKAPIFLCCCAVSLAAISAFLRSGFILKLIAMIVALIGQTIVLGYSDLFVHYNVVNYNNGCVLQQPN